MPGAIDVRSDTVTQPTSAMLQAMLQARVGDDVYGEDETVNELQEQGARLFGKEAALFCPTGTMSNQIGIKVHTQPGDEVICDGLSHVYLFEGGGIAANCGASVRLLHGQNGRFSADQARENINRRDDSHLPWTRVVAIENTVNRGGGCCWDLREIERIRKVCDEQSIAMHLDGARVFNALVARGETAADHGRWFDTVSICLSKGLGAPAGSLLLGSGQLIAKAHRYRKLMGGGMRQSGYLAAAGLFALNNNIQRLKEDHEKARILAVELRARPFVADILPVETNIVIIKLADGIAAESFLKRLRSQQVRASSMGPQLVRFVFHLDISDAQFESIVRAVRSV